MEIALRSTLCLYIFNIKQYLVLLEEEKSYQRCYPGGNSHIEIRIYQIKKDLLKDLIKSTRDKSRCTKYNQKITNKVS